MTKPARQRLAVASQLSRGLSLMTRKFCELLAMDPNHNQTHAARGAGYRDPKTRGSKLLAIPKVRAYYEALLHAATEIARTDGVTPESLPAPPPDPDLAAALAPAMGYKPATAILGVAMEAAEIERRLSDHARADILDFISYETVLQKDGTPLLTKEGMPVYRPFVDVMKIEALGKGHLVKKLKEGQYGTEIELVDGQSALKTLAQIRGLTGDENDDHRDAPRLRSWQQFLRTLPPSVVLEMNRNLLSTGGAVIETTAQVSAHA